MKAFRDLSIRGKLIVMMVTVTTIALGCGFALVIIDDITSAKQDMVDRTTTTARGIGDYCVTPLAFGDKDGAADMLAKLNVIPSITNAAVYDAEGSLFAALDPAPMPHVHHDREAISQFTRDRLLIHEPIEHEGEHYGVIHVQASTEPLREQIFSHVLHMQTVMLGLIVVSILLAVRFQRIISGPILNLAGVVERLAVDNTYSIRVEKLATMKSARSTTASTRCWSNYKTGRWSVTAPSSRRPTPSWCNPKKWPPSACSSPA